MADVVFTAVVVVVVAAVIDATRVAAAPCRVMATVEQLAQSWRDPGTDTSHGLR